jgi:uncharacterized protein (TIGR02145 family)
MKKISKSTLTLITIIFISISGCKKKEVPVVETKPVSFISGSSAVSGGNITDDRGETVLSRGVCWSTGIKPSISDNKSSDGAGAGSFSSTAADLLPATDYFIRAYATSSSGTGYGMVMSFKTFGQVPVTTTLPATDLTTTSAKLSASINANYLSTTVIFEYGPTASYGSSVVATQSPVAGNTLSNVTVVLSGLSAGTTYHYRVKAENSLGITYGNDLTIKTLGQVPTAVTQAATSLTITSALLNGNINANYLSTVVTFEFGLTSSYGSSIVATQSPVTLSTTIPVNKSLTGLTSGTLYHYRVKAENSLGVTYGNDMTFTTLGLIPYASTQDVVGITSTSAILRGLVSGNNLSTSVTFEYGTSDSYGEVINASPNIVTGNTIVLVSASISGLTTGATYHFRIRAVNSLGTTNGTDLTFVASGPAPVVDVEGNAYSIVNIGTQTWMAENLKTTKYNDNTTIPLVTDNAAWIALSTPAYCWYNNDLSGNKDTYGAIYNFYTVSTGKLCPAGWHVPTDAEFITLTDYLGGINSAGGKLKETGTINWLSPNVGATNETGFKALPAGQRDEYGAFIGLNQNAIFWSSTPYNIYKPWYRSLSYIASSVFVGNGSLNIRGFSIRCIKD